MWILEALLLNCPLMPLALFFPSVQAKEEEESAKCVCLWFRKKIPRLNFFTRPAAADYKANKGELVIRNQSVLLEGKKAIKGVEKWGEVNTQYPTKSPTGILVQAFEKRRNLLSLVACLNQFNHTIKFMESLKSLPDSLSDLNCAATLKI